MDTYSLSDDGAELTQTSLFVRDSNGQKETFKTVWRRMT